MNGMAERGRTRAAPVSTDAGALEKTRPHEGDEAARAGVSVAGISGGVSYGRGGDAEGWRPASVGLPVATGDRLYAARGGQLELDSAGFAIHLASATGLEALELTDDVKRFYVWGGSASFLVRQLTPGESFGVDSPSARVTFERAGDYRIDVGREGDTCVVVDRGNSRVSAAGVSVPLGPGDLARIDGIRAPGSGSPPLPSRRPRDGGGATRPGRSREQVLPFPSGESR